MIINHFFLFRDEKWQHSVWEGKKRLREIEGINAYVGGRYRYSQLQAHSMGNIIHTKKEEYHYHYIVIIYISFTGREGERELGTWTYKAPFKKQKKEGRKHLRRLHIKNCYNINFAFTVTTIFPFSFFFFL